MRNRRRVKMSELATQTERAGRTWYVTQAIGTRRWGILFVKGVKTEIVKPPTRDPHEPL